MTSNATEQTWRRLRQQKHPSILPDPPIFHTSRANIKPFTPKPRKQQHRYVLNPDDQLGHSDVLIPRHTTSGAQPFGSKHLAGRVYVCQSFRLHSFLSMSATRKRGKLRAIDTIEINEQKITAHVQANFHEVSRDMCGETAMPCR
jgi:hypothetical protein